MAAPATSFAIQPSGARVRASLSLSRSLFKVSLFSACQLCQVCGAELRALRQSRASCHRQTASQLATCPWRVRRPNAQARPTAATCQCALCADAEQRRARASCLPSPGAWRLLVRTHKRTDASRSSFGLSLGVRSKSRSKSQCRRISSPALDGARARLQMPNTFSHGDQGAVSWTRAGLIALRQRRLIRISATARRLIGVLIGSDHSHFHRSHRPSPKAPAAVFLRPYWTHYISVLLAAHFNGQLEVSITYSVHTETLICIYCPIFSKHRTQLTCHLEPNR